MTKLHQYTLATEAPTEAAVYYEWLLGLQPQDAPGAALAELGVGVGTPPAPGAAGWSPVFLVRSVDEAILRASAEGPVEHLVSGSGGAARHLVRVRDSAWTVLQEFSSVGEHEPSAYWHANCDYSTPDPTQATRYLGALLGLDHHAIIGDPYHMRFLHGDRMIATGILRMHGVSAYPKRPHWLVYFEVGDLVTAVARAVDSGSRIRIPRSRSPFNDFAVLTDPWGSLFGFSTMTPSTAVGPIPTLGGDGAVCDLRDLVDIHPPHSSDEFRLPGPSHETV
ncbi:VOC family protein [Streptomyces sp. NPDC057486]|uniref:VOC family protein n=1 Tax=Streptomyces sp. NPDC057486 TaxID=3346145 RepID=UPI0036B05EB5